MGFWDKRVAPGAAAAHAPAPVQPVPPMYPVQQYPAQVAHQVPFQPAQQQQVMDLQAYKRMLGENLHTHRIGFGEAARAWADLGGGDGTRVEGGSHCPSCGGGHYFSRAVLRDQNDQLRRPRIPPAPLCMTCGYSGDEAYRQYGETTPLDPKAPIVNQ